MSDTATKTVTVAAPAFPITGVLGVAFIVLKLCHVIAWPWLWVLAPFWLPLAIGLGIMALCLLFLLVVACLVGRR